MTDASATPPAVLLPPGLPLADAAGWVGRACWAELRLHEVLTGWLAIEADPEQTEVLWSERSDAAERAAAWHARLPELREYPRSTFIAPGSPEVERLFDGLAALDQPDATDARRGALAAVLRGLRLGYHRRRQVAVGPADGPTATTIAAALRSTFGEGGADPDPAWTTAVADAGGLP